jgi:NADH:ubiquinone oxidoreductase subunit E
MQNKIKIVICTGTACFVMGGSELLLLEENLPEHIKAHVDISGTTCIDNCKNDQNGKSPFVEINGVVMSEATIPKVIDYVKELYKTRRN